MKPIVVTKAHALIILMWGLLLSLIIMTFSLFVTMDNNDELMKLALQDNACKCCMKPSEYKEIK